MVTFHGNHSFSTKYKLKSFSFHWTHLFQLFCKLPAQIGSSCHKNHPFACKISFRHLFSRLSPSIQDRHHLALGSHLCCQSEFSVGTVTLVKSHSVFQSATLSFSWHATSFSDPNTRFLQRLDQDAILTAYVLWFFTCHGISPSSLEKYLHTKRPIVLNLNMHSESSFGTSTNLCSHLGSFFLVSVLFPFP